jgi:hypothetical protein
MDFKQYQEISIHIGGVLAPTAVFTRMIHCRIESITDKAIQLRAYNMETKEMELSKQLCWIPKKALIKPQPIPGIGEAHYFKLAKWFKPEGFTEWFLTRYANIGGSTAQ